MLIRRGIGVLVLLGVLALLVLGLREAEHRVFGGGPASSAVIARS